MTRLFCIALVAVLGCVADTSSEVSALDEMVSIGISVPGGVTITIPQLGMTCSQACTITVASGTSVVLVATPSVGTLITGWTGPCSSAGAAHTCALLALAPGSNPGTGPVVSFVQNNLVFVSSTQVTGDLGAATYDRVCNNLATAAHINNVKNNGYIAWVQAAGHDPTVMIGASRGWTRVDGKPWVNDMALALNQSVTFYPPVVDENGVRTFDTYWTGMQPGGAIWNNCADWGMAGIDAGITYTHSVGWGWTQSYNLNAVGCKETHRLLCVGIGRIGAVGPGGNGTKRIYLTNQGWQPNGGVAAADARCNLDKPMGVGKVKAVLTASTRKFEDVLAPNAIYARPDGVVVGSTDDLLKALRNPIGPLTLESAPAMKGDGTFAATWLYAWSGNTDTCRDWTSKADDDRGTTGDLGDWADFGVPRWAPSHCAWGGIYLRCAEQ